MKDGKARPRVQLLRRRAHQHRRSTTACPRASTRSSTSSSPTAPKPGTGGNWTLFVDGQKVAEAHIPKTQPFAFSADEGADVGIDGETTVSNDYKPGDNKFTGKIVKVTVDVKPSQMSAADKKAVDDAKDAAAIIED